jgi:hypothetical protein
MSLAFDGFKKNLKNRNWFERPAERPVSDV